MPGPGNVGERVRNLRLTRRLSQAQLAGHDLSDSYISLIESGKRTPTPAVLRLLAERLGCTPEYLAEGIEPEQRAHLEVRERHAQLDLLSGDPAKALAGFDDVIARSDDAELSARARWGRAQALEDLGRTEAAIAVFEELREQAERDPGRTSWLPAVIALARCYHGVGDLGQAISLGERALGRLHELGLNAGPEHTEVGRVLLLAYVDRSDPEKAHELGRRVLADTEPAGAPISAAYQRASARALEQGTVGEALYFADRAIGVQGEGTRVRTRARLQTAAARALLRGVAPYAAESGTVAQAAKEALQLLRAAAPDLEGQEATECAIETARALVLLGEPQQAIATLEQRAVNGSRPYGGNEALELEAVQARLVLAQAQLAQDDRRTALTILHATTERLDKLTQGRPVAHVFRELGELFEAAGDGSGATRAYRRALEAAGLRPSRPQPAADLAGR